MSSNSDTTLVTSIKEEVSNSHTEGIMVRRFMLNGDPGERRVVATVRHRYPRIEDVESRLAELDGQKVTLLLGGETTFGATMLIAREGRLFNEGRAILPKGARQNGFRVSAAAVLDVVVGYGGAAVLQERVDAVLTTVIRTTSLSWDMLRELPDPDDRDEMNDTTPNCKLAVLGTLRLPDMDECFDAVWLIHSYIKTDDIVEGVLFVRPESGESEHGSVHGNDLLHRHNAGVIGLVDIPVSTAFDWLDLDHDELIHRVLEATQVKV